MAKVRSLHIKIAFLVMATLSGLIGFLIVYHYATLQRPLQHFAIVIDAGSTQTRSSLFTIQVDSASLAEPARPVLDEAEEEPLKLSELLHVKQVSTCVNGGPLAAIQSKEDGRQLVRRCLVKFAKHIKQLDFLSNQEGEEDAHEEDDDTLLDSEEVANKLALLNHRVNSVTHLHLGATAGMRALSQLNPARANAKMGWMEAAIEEGNSFVPNGSPFINKGFVGVMKGSDEAAFGWASVNFACNRLVTRGLRRALPRPLEAEEAVWPHVTNRTLYRLADLSSNKRTRIHRRLDSVGTLELGGASSQMAYQLRDWLPGDHVRNWSLTEQRLELFDTSYRLATRSDLCLGMSQAVLRSNFVLWRDFYDNGARAGQTLDLVNPCLQNGSKTTLGSAELAELLNHAPCLVSSELDAESLAFREWLSRKVSARFKGTGQVDQCDSLLSRLIQPTICRRYFSLCPASKNRNPPPRGLPFVTISGYNKALQVLGLGMKQATLEAGDAGLSDIELAIYQQLGGYSIDHAEFTRESRRFCSHDVAELADRYPKMNKRYHSINCLQLVYINKLLTEFHLFEPATSWSQIKFLLFPVPSATPNGEQARRKEHQDMNDIGWTIGFLLNATSSQYAANSTELAERTIYYHHAAYAFFVARATIMLMLACVLLALSVIVVGALMAKRLRSGSARISSGSAYGSTSPGCSSLQEA